MAHGASQSARGVSGEAAGLRAKDAVSAVGGDVPNYTIYGTHHHNKPTKDKAKLASAMEHQEWSRKPAHRTRTELWEARRAERYPHISADIDGDGVVGPVDVFIAKKFSSAAPEGKLRLNAGERKKAVEALENGLMDKYSFGHDQAGVLRPFPVQQRRGMVVTVDNAHELSKTYPAHPSSSKVPRHPTRTDLSISRRNELHDNHEAMYQKWAEKNPAVAMEKCPRQEGYTENPPMSNIAERTDSYKLLARQKAGLDVPTYPVNPAREAQEVGLGFREAPPATTAVELREQRRVDKVQALKEARVKAEESYVPRKVHQTSLAAQHFENQRVAEEPMTFTRLQFDRKQERIETNMRDFEMVHHPTHPRYSDQGTPWWTLQEGYVPEPPPCLLHELSNPDAEVTAKPTQVAPKKRGVQQTRADREQRENVQRAGHDPKVHLARNARHGLRLNPGAPLPFYNEKEAKYEHVRVKHAAAYSSDSAPLEAFSTFSAGVPDAQNPVLLQQERHAAEAYQNARAWKSYTKRGGEPLFDSASPASPLLLGAPLHSQYDQFANGSSHQRSLFTIDSRGSNGTAAAGAAETSPKGPQTARLSLTEPRPAISEDLPMSARLHRLGNSMKGPDRTQAYSAPRRREVAGGTITPRLANGGSISSLDATMRGPGQGRSKSVAVRSSGFQWLTNHLDLPPPSPTHSMSQAFPSYMEQGRPTRDVSRATSKAI